MVNLQNPILYSGSISVRRVRVSDARTLENLLINNRDWLQKWEATLPGYNRAEPGTYSLRGPIRQMIKEAKKGSRLPMVMLLNGEVVGQLTVSDITWGPLCSANIGYWVSEHAAGRGVTTTSVALVIDHLILTMGLHRVEICLRPENGPSRRVVDKLGLRFEGLREKFLHIDGGWRDHHCFAVTAEEIGGGLIHRLTA